MTNPFTQAPEHKDDSNRCPICDEPFKADDICATDIELLTCHASCLEGVPVVDLETGDPLPESDAHTYRYSEETEGSENG